MKKKILFYPKNLLFRIYIKAVHVVVHPPFMNFLHTCMYMYLYVYLYVTKKNNIGLVHLSDSYSLRIIIRLLICQWINRALYVIPLDLIFSIFPSDINYTLNVIGKHLTIVKYSFTFTWKILYPCTCTIVNCLLFINSF